MSVPRTQVVALVVASVASVALAVGGIAILAGSRSAAASTDTPEASIAGGSGGSGGSTVVPVLPGESASAGPESGARTATPGAEATPEATPEATALGPIDAEAIAAGLDDGGYRFTVTTINFASFAAASPSETGVVRDAEHFSIAWPRSEFISRYVRDGDSRTAWLGDSIVDLVPGDGWERTPDEMLPIDFYTAAIGPWTASLPPGSDDGTYTAGTAVLTSAAQAIGVTATDWGLSVTVDGRGRLVAARFEGLVSGHPFRMAIDIAYEDTTGSAIPTVAPAAEAPEGAAEASPAAVPSPAAGS